MILRTCKSTWRKLPAEKITKQDYENENIIESLKEFIKPDFVATCDNLELRRGSSYNHTYRYGLLQF